MHKYFWVNLKFILYFLWTILFFHWSFFISHFYKHRNNIYIFLWSFWKVCFFRFYCWVADDLKKSKGIPKIWQGGTFTSLAEIYILQKYLQFRSLVNAIPIVFCIIRQQRTFLNYCTQCDSPHLKQLGTRLGGI